MSNPHSSQDRVLSAVRSCTSLTSGARILVALSGGPDSVALAHALVQCAAENTWMIAAAHLNHEWRACAAHDEQVCRDLCKDLGITLYVTTKSNRSPEKSTGSVEADARHMRQAWFQELVRAHGFTHVALAHHADDQLETFFIRLARGASLEGLIGMRAQRDVYVRPFLSLKKSDLIAYCTDQGLAYAVDPTNESDAYLRNRIRNQLVPALDYVDERFKDNIIATMQRLGQAYEALTLYTNQCYAQAVQIREGKRLLDIPQWLTHPLYIRRQILTKWLYEHNVSCTVSESLLKELERFIDSGKHGPHALGSTHVLVRQGTRLSITSPA